jgi:hypothetical protein
MRLFGVFCLLIAGCTPLYVSHIEHVYPAQGPSSGIMVSYTQGRRVILRGTCAF